MQEMQNQMQQMQQMQRHMLQQPERHPLEPEPQTKSQPRMQQEVHPQPTQPHAEPQGSVSGEQSFDPVASLSIFISQAGLAQDRANWVAKLLLHQQLDAPLLLR